MTSRGLKRAISLLACAALVLGCSSTPTATEPATGNPSSSGPISTNNASPSGGATVRPSQTSFPTAAVSPTAAPTVAPTSTPAPTPRPTPRPTPAPTQAPKPAPTPVAWDPNAVSVTLSTIATVPGRPLAIANAGDGSGRLFVAGQAGAVYSIDGGSVNPTPFLDISGKVSGGGEQGLLGLAFHPDYPADPRVFVYYTDPAGNIVVSSFVLPAGADVITPNTETVILTVDHSTYGNHNGGGLLFGPDGYLYIATGDGGGGGDPFGSGQDLGMLLGKILRIDVDHPSDGRAYGIPAGNPFVSVGGARDEIWLTGLRNPFRFSFDRSTGDLWLGDVGQGQWEEVDVARASVGGLNFGWNVMEGAHCFSPSSGCATSGLTLPVVEYDHGPNGGLAVIGGHVYRGSMQTVLKGGYIFSDNYTGWIWAVAATATTPQVLVRVGQGAAGLAGYGESEAGELFGAALDGSIYRVVGTAR